jgi:hypothetical protein
LDTVLGVSCPQRYPISTGSCKLSRHALRKIGPIILKKFLDRYLASSKYYFIKYLIG